MSIIKTTKKETILKLATKCDRCGNCCSYTSGYVLDSEVPSIAKFMELDEKEFTNWYLTETDLYHKKVHKLRANKRGNYSSCVFFDKGKGCSIQDVKPFYCRISTCSKDGDDIAEWFAVNHLVDLADPESIRLWNLHCRLKKTIPGAKPEELVKDKSQLKSILNYEIIN